MDGNGNGGQGGGAGKRVASIGISVDLDTFTFQVTGDVPRLEVAVMLARHLAFTLEQQLIAAQRPQIVGATSGTMPDIFRRARG